MDPREENGVPVKRFCNDCGIRDLPGEFRYPAGFEFWDGNVRSKSWVRCRLCLKVAKPIGNCCFGVCVSCYGGSDRNMLENSFESPTTNECSAQNAPTLSSLPPEILLAIVTHLRMDDTLILRDVSQFFSTFIPQPTHEQLLAEEKEDYAYRRKLYACGGCLRLLQFWKFDWERIEPSDDRLGPSLG